MHLPHYDGSKDLKFGVKLYYIINNRCCFIKFFPNQLLLRCINFKSMLCDSQIVGTMSWEKEDKFVGAEM